MSMLASLLAVFGRAAVLVPILSATLVGCLSWNIQAWRAEGRIARIETRIANERAAMSEKLAREQEVARMQSERQYEAVNEIRNEADHNLAQVLAAERAAADKRLRRQADAFAKRQAYGCQGAQLASVSNPTSNSIGMLAELLGDLDEMAERYASEADRRRVAGLACEQTYKEIENR